MACLAKDPTERPQTAQELDRKLAACDGLQPWSQERAQQWWDLHMPCNQKQTGMNGHAGRLSEVL
jgi:hypothetical protein